MMHFLVCLSFIWFNAICNTNATPDEGTIVHQIKAIVPTVAGQIGVNPVSVYEISTAFNPGDSVPVKTITAADATSTISAPFAVVTQANGDLSFPPTPDGKTKLQALFDEVTAACAGISKVRRGDVVKRSGQCELDQLSTPGAGGGILEFDLPGISIPTFTAGDVSVALQSVPAAVAVAFIAYVIGDGKVSDDTAANVPASNLAPSITRIRQSSASAVPTTTNDDYLDSIYTADDSVYTSMAQDILARISAGASADNALFDAAPTAVPLPQADCDRTTLTNMETNVFRDLGSVFCKDIDLNNDLSKDLINKDVNTDAFADYKFHLEWKHAGGSCESLDCTEMFNAFSSACSYNSHSMYSTGSLAVDCGTASYTIIPPGNPSSDSTSTPAPSPTPTLALNTPTCREGAPLKLDEIQDKVKEFCEEAVDKGWHWEQRETIDSDYIVNNGIYSGVAVHKYSDVSSEDGSQCLDFSITVKQASCAPGADYSVDFKKIGKDACIENFMVTVNGCAPFVIPSDSKYWKKGGIKHSDCLEWEVGSDPC